ncbi:glycosyltransferase family 2 protein [Chryseobacterium cheonjiense]|uniref:Glycosyltransferase family 2 protein n=1 Tax=Chryseobacterium cheonjiense TaxID=2728845 RepID=A0A7Y0A8M6_9FLAO|nr:glycosyltransferase family 2 protein [Chryseobacterium cheonjiense]NML58685.1 glycosyltransferase family 2 protein [Chryseobacterium cheonjiense]
MSLLSRISSRFITITYGITVNDETRELKYLLDTLLPLIDKNDEVIVLQDITNENREVSQLLENYSNIILLKAKLNGDFAAFKNKLIEKATSQYLFQIDADEYPTEHVIKTLKPYLKKEKSVDVFFVPRINIVEGITQDYVDKMGWNLNNEGYINFPDYQARILKNNKKIFWKNKVHEVLFGNKNFTEIPKDYRLSLIHKKNFEKQKKQNDFYETLED